jgi:hypothetical protein
LYEYELAGVPGQRGRLTDLTVDKAGDGAGVLGVAQISEDGSYVYFGAEGALAAGASVGQRNLYVWHEGTVGFIATLAAGDVSDWENGLLDPANEAGPTVNTAVVNPSGTRLAFLSGASLKGYDNQQAAHGDCEQESEGGLCNEVFLYDAESGGLVCASCDPTGARPVGPSRFRPLPQQVIGLYRPRNLLDDGVLFFESADAILPGASDGRKNVYEFEGGRVYAISDVTGGYESFFLDSSPTGDDVFFATADHLLERQDTGNNLVVFDARVDGGFPVAAPACTTAEACRNASPPTPYVFGAPPSATFSGPGNISPPAPNVVKPKPKSLTRAQKLANALKVCAKDKKKSKRAKCQKQAKSKYGAAKKAKKSRNNRRASR